MGRRLCRLGNIISECLPRYCDHNGNLVEHLVYSFAYDGDHHSMRPEKETIPTHNSKHARAGVS